MNYQYSVPPEHYSKYYSTTSPHGSYEYVDYVPKQQYSTPPKAHRRQTSYTPSPRGQSGYYYSTPEQIRVPKDTYAYAAAPGKDPYVSYEKRPRASSYSMPTSKAYPRTTRKPSHPIHVYESGDEYAKPQVVNREPPSRTKPQHYKKPSTDRYMYFSQDQIYKEQAKKSSHARKSSTASKSSPQQKTRSRKPIPQATEADAKRAGIPVGYSIKNWDPTELPIILLGSVFDANSLGKWIYDWTVYTHGAKSPIADMAGDLWLLLIKLAGKTKRAEERVHRIHDPEDQEMVEEFIESGNRLWKKFKLLLKECEYYMMTAAKKQGSKTMMGKNAGTEFVESIFGRDRNLEDTEKIMNNIRLWTMRFDVNCEDIIRRPSHA